MLAAIGVLALLLAALLVGALWLTIPGSNQIAVIPGLTGPVGVAFDADMVPRIQVTSEIDAAAALGFVHARDRLFQMDLMRRAASGRLSEIAGPATLRIDRMMRILGLRQRAVADLAALPADTNAMLEAYARGVNAWIELKGRFAAPEFLVLGTPDPWQPTDSLLWAKTMGLWLSMNWHQELSRQALSGKLPAAMIDQLWPLETGAPSPDAMAKPLTRFAGAAIPAVIRAAPVPSAVYDALHSIERVGGRWTTQRERRTAARRRPASRVRLSRHLVPGEDRHARASSCGCHRAGRAVSGARTQRKDRLDIHHHRRRRAGRVHRNPGGTG